jgi:hypothetical protein
VQDEDSALLPIRPGRHLDVKAERLPVLEQQVLGFIGAQVDDERRSIGRRRQ